MTLDKYLQIIKIIDFSNADTAGCTTLFLRSVNSDWDQAWNINIEVKQKCVSFKQHTGAHVTIISQKTYKYLGCLPLTKKQKQKKNKRLFGSGNKLVKSKTAGRPRKMSRQDVSASCQA